MGIGKALVGMSAKDVRSQTDILRNAGLSNDEIQEQLKLKGFDPYEPPVSGRVDGGAYQQWRRASMEAGAEPSADRPMIDQAQNYEKTSVPKSEQANSFLTQKRIEFNEAKFADINKTATENLYNEMPEVRGDYGRANVQGLAEFALASALAKSLTPSVAGEGSDEIPLMEKGRPMLPDLSQSHPEVQALLTNPNMQKAIQHISTIKRGPGSLPDGYGRSVINGEEVVTPPSQVARSAPIQNTNANGDELSASQDADSGDNFDPTEGYYDNLKKDEIGNPYISPMGAMSGAAIGGTSKSFAGALLEKALTPIPAQQ